MAVASKMAESPWQAGRGECAGRRRRASPFPFLLRVLVAAAAGLLLSHCLMCDSVLGQACALVVLATAPPLLAGWLLKERLGAARTQPFRREVPPACAGEERDPVDGIAAWLLVVSPDLRVRFANRAFLNATSQSLEDVLGWQLGSVLPGEGLEEQAKALLDRSYAATSCCLTTCPGQAPGEHRSVSITMTHLPPVEGEDRILVVVEDLLQNVPRPQASWVEGYIC